MRWVPHWGVRKDVVDIKHRSSTSPCGASHGRSSHVKSLSWHHLSFFFFLYMPDVSFPPTYWRKKKKRKNIDTHLWPCCPFPILFILCLFSTKLQFYFLHCLCPMISPPNQLLQFALTSLPVPRSFCHFHFLTWFGCFNNVDESFEKSFSKYINKAIFTRPVESCILKSQSSMILLNNEKKTLPE